MDIRITLAALLLRRNKDLYEVARGDERRSWLGAMAVESTKRTLKLKEAEKIIGFVKALKAGS